MSLEFSTDGLEALYESLSRFQWFRRVISGARPGERLEIHKRLAPSPGITESGVDQACLHDWLLALVNPAVNARILEVGCGFGAGPLRWALRKPGTYVGLSPSPFQIKKAREQANRLGLTRHCTFRIQSYDDPIDGSFDCTFSVESLFHSEDLARTLKNLSGCMLPGSEIGLVEDMTEGRDVEETPSARRLMQCWATPRLYSAQDYREALSHAGFDLKQEIDLSDRVRVRSMKELDARRTRWNRIKSFLPHAGARRVIDAFQGGLELERLYASGSMRYLTMVAVRRSAGA